ncbi:MAG TPA: hypothetical protein VNA13_02765 [Xanthomonadales bacterium]|nr:hypothetical protein [Xanthomonadales bacterium]
MTRIEIQSHLPTRTQLDTVFAAQSAIIQGPAAAEGFSSRIVQKELQRRNFLAAVIAENNGLPLTSLHHQSRLASDSPYQDFFAMTEPKDRHRRCTILAAAIVENTEHYSSNFKLERSAAEHIENPWVAMRVYNTLKEKGDAEGIPPELTIRLREEEDSILNKLKWYGGNGQKPYNVFPKVPDQMSRDPEISNEHPHYMHRGQRELHHADLGKKRGSRFCPSRRLPKDPA